jgi:ASC-1-like (ASCH) protein
LEQLQNGKKTYEGRYGIRKLVRERAPGDNVVYVAGKYTMRRTLDQVRTFPCASDMIQELGCNSLLPECRSNSQALCIYASIVLQKEVFIREARRWDAAVRAGSVPFVAWSHVQERLDYTHFTP